VLVQTLPSLEVNFASCVIVRGILTKKRKSLGTDAAHRCQIMGLCEQRNVEFISQQLNTCEYRCR
jgi:hypothetical protein